ncbi:MAG: aspartate kinase [Bdellovibrionaceae bacterium]|nr:aspartate kinase [Pseudobdellovibrionaceae bacterium]MCB9092898.1 aspartate kinase [Halobacteriovoraceae bacterium]
MKTQSELLVKKFGGTSVGSIERIENVAERIKLDCQNGQVPVVVASAMSGETNRLVRLASDINPQYRGLAYDMLLASGEQVSIALLAMALEKRGLKAIPLLAYQLGIRTDSLFSQAKIQSINTQKIMELIDKKTIPIVAGFQGVNMDDYITTLGRGGSDTTAVAIAAALGCEQVEIYTDVPKVFTADPRLIPKAREISRLSFEEMMEMATLGSKVLHFRCVELAAKYNVKIHVRSTFETREGTWVVAEDEKMENPVVSAVTHDASTAIVKLFPVPFGANFLAQLFESLAEKGVIVDIITQSYNEEGQRLAFSVNETDLYMVEEVLKSLDVNAKIVILKDMAKLSVVGVGMANHPGVAARFFKVLSQKEVPLHLVSTSDIKISAVIDRKNLEKTAQALHTEFALDKDEK